MHGGGALVTLLHREPREVYRVYSEEEFWAIAERELHEDSRVGRSTPRRSPDEEGQRGQRTLRRLAASTVLLTALGTCSGLVLIAAVPDGSRDGHRGAARLLAATGPLSTGRGGNTHIWQQASPLEARRSVTRAGASVDARAGSMTPATVHASRVSIAASHAPSASAPSVVPGAPDASAEARLPSASAAASPYPPAGAALAPAASVSEASVSEAPASEATASEATASMAAPSEVASSAPSQDQHEFGFER
jgi:hypothetical protein